MQKYYPTQEWTSNVAHLGIMAGRREGGLQAQCFLVPLPSRSAGDTMTKTSPDTSKSLEFTTFKIAEAIIFRNKNKHTMQGGGGLGGDQKGGLDASQRDFGVIREGVIIRPSSSQHED